MKHEWLETHINVLVALTIVAISIGGLVEILPLFFIERTVESVQGVQPYTPLELLGRNLYQREGCYFCHSQMIRPLREDWMRYGHYSLAAESKYDHPPLWGSRRIGPDLARIGGKYSNTWHVQHLTMPRSVIPSSRMPNYPWLKKNLLTLANLEEHLQTLAATGVPYTENEKEYQDNVTHFGATMARMLDISQARANLIAQVELLNYDGERTQITEMDALVAYLQVLGTMINFNNYDEDYFIQFR